MSKIGVVLTVPQFSLRCMTKNSLLFPATLKWVKRMGMIEKTAIIGDNKEALRMAKDLGVKFVIDAPRGGHDHDILKAADALGDIAVDGVVLAQVTSPYREAWLLDDVLASMASHSSKVTRVKSRLCADTGALHGFPRGVLELMCAGTEIADLDSVYVEQNEDNVLDVDYPRDAVWIKTQARKVEQADKMKRPVCLPKHVAIVGSNAGMKGGSLGLDIDAYDCVIRVNHLHSDYADDVGRKMDYHFSKFPNLLEQSPAEKRVCSEAIFTSPAYRISMHAVTPSVATLYAGIDGGFVSTGMKAVIWALHNGAEFCDLYGFGRGLNNKVNIDTDKTDESGWVEREDKLLLILQADGRIKLH